MTPYQDVYDAFLAQILDDEWVTWGEEETAEEMKQNKNIE